MAWTNIPNANLAAGAPIRSVDTLALRDNIPALAAGDSGAPKIVLKAFNDIYSSNAVAGTTIISAFFTLNGNAYTSDSAYPDVNNSGFDIVVNDAGVSGQAVLRNGNQNGGQFAYIAAIGGTYRVSFLQDNTASNTTEEARIVINSTAVYTVSHTGGTNTTRTFDITVNPFDRIVIQFRRSVAGSGESTLRVITIGTTGGGLLLQRT